MEIRVKANYVSGDFELVAKDGAGRIIAADTFREPVNALTAVDKLREQYPDATMKFGPMTTTESCPACLASSGEECRPECLSWS